MNLPSIRQLECVVAVLDSLSFRKAAAACHITQPALSAQIQQLETLLGIKLFERNRRQVLPTAAGVAIAEKARRILAEVQELSTAAISFQKPLSGTLRLGVIPTVAPYFLPRAFREVHRAYPELRLLLKEGQTAELVTQLHDGNLDLLLVALEADLDGLETLPLFSDPFVLAVSREHRLANRKQVSEDDLRDAELLLLDDGH